MQKQPCEKKKTLYIKEKIKMITHFSLENYTNKKTVEQYFKILSEKIK